jgi:hypothetical protein
VVLSDQKQINQKILDGPALQPFSVRNCRFVHAKLPERALFPETLMQLVMRIEFLSRMAPITLLETVLAALQRLLADRYNRGRLADTLEKNRRGLAALSNDRLLYLGSILMVVARRLAESGECEVEASVEGTKRLGQVFSRAWKTLDNDPIGAFFGKIRGLLNRVLDSTGLGPEVIDPEHRSPVGGVIRAVELPRAIDLDISHISPMDARMARMTSGLVATLPVRSTI